MKTFPVRLDNKVRLNQIQEAVQMEKERDLKGLLLWELDLISNNFKLQQPGLIEENKTLLWASSRLVVV